MWTPKEPLSDRTLIARDTHGALWVEDGPTVIRSMDDRDLQNKAILSQTKPDGSLQDSVHAVEGTDNFIVQNEDGAIFHALPYYRESHFAFARDRLYHHWSGHAVVDVYNTELNHRNQITMPHDGAALTSSDRRDMIDSDWQPAHMASDFRQVLRARIPDRWPATRGFFADDRGRVWLGLRDIAEDTTVWVVTDAEENLHGWVDMPQSIQLEAAQGDIVYAVDHEDASGGPVVVKYELQQ